MIYVYFLNHFVKIKIYQKYLFKSTIFKFESRPKNLHEYSQVRGRHFDSICKMLSSATAPIFRQNCFMQLKFLTPAVSSVAKRTLSVREVWGSTPGPVESTQCRQRLATVATFLRSCVAQALSRGDGPRNSLHASA